MTVAFVQSWTSEGLYQKGEDGKDIYETGEDGKRTRTPTYSNSFSISNLSGTSTVATEEYASKINTYRYGNKDILSKILDEGKLGESTSIRGWSIVAVYSDLGYDGSSAATGDILLPTCYARHTDKTMVQIEGLTIGLLGGVRRASVKTVTSTRVTEFDETERVSNAYSSNYKIRSSLTGPPFLFSLFALQGMLSGSERFSSKTSYYYEDVYDEINDREVRRRYADTVWLRVPGALKLDKLTGTLNEGGKSPAFWKAPSPFQLPQW